MGLGFDCMAEDCPQWSKEDELCEIDEITLNVKGQCIFYDVDLEEA